MAEAEVAIGRVRTDEPAAPVTLGFSLKVPAILVVLVAGLILRLLLATFPGFGVDVGTFMAWSFQLADTGPWNFYDTDFFTDYAPGYLYILWLIGELRQSLADIGLITFTNKQYEFVLKLPSIAADLGSAYLLYRLLEGQRQEARVGAALAYLLLPVTWFTGAVWGQVDSVLAFLLLLSVYFIGHGRPLRGAVAYTIGFLVKPQAIAALPFLAFWIMKQHPPRWEPWIKALPTAVGVALVVLGAFVAGWRHLEGDSGAALIAVLAAAFGVVLLLGASLIPSQGVSSDELPPLGERLARYGPVPPDVWYLATVVPAAVLLLGIFPFFTFKPWEFLDQLDFAQGYYAYASFHAYNFWSTFAYLEPDRVEYLGVSYNIWGYVLYAIATAFVLYALRRAEGMGALTLGVALSIFVFYMFVTRMHERYIFPVFLPLLAACVILNNRWLWAAFCGIAAINLLNLYHAYAEFNDNYVRIDWVFNWLQDPDFWGLGLTTVEFLSVFMVIMLPPLLAVAYALGDGRKEAPAGHRLSRG